MADIVKDFVDVVGALDVVVEGAGDVVTLLGGQGHVSKSGCVGPLRGAKVVCSNLNPPTFNSVLYNLF